MTSINKALKHKYDTLYSDKTEKWRQLGAIQKAANIMEVCRKLEFSNLIEIGAGDGNILAMLSEHNFCQNLWAAEISDSAIEQMKKKQIKHLKNISSFDGYKLPYDDKSFDLAVCSHVIEHVEHPRILMAEIKRISKYQVFEVPIDFSFQVDKKFAHFNAYGHINIYTPALFNFLLLSTGFSILQRKYGFYSNEVIKFMYKPFSLKYIATHTKRLLWKCIPWLMKVKPNTYTVLCK